MDRWFKLYHDLLNDPTVQRLPPDEFKAQLMAAMQGEQTAFSRFLRRGSDRPPTSVWSKLRALVFARDDYTCAYCGARAGRLECDHVVPVSRGGSNELANLATACKPCNQSKRNKLVEEWKP